MLAKAGEVATYLSDTFSPVLTAIVTPIKEVVTEFLAFVSAGESLKEKLKLAGDFLLEYVTDTLLPDLLAKAIELKDALVGWVANVWPGMKVKFVTFIKDITAWYTGTYLPFLVKKALELKDAAVEWVPKIWGEMEPKIVTFLASLTTWLSGTALPAIKLKLGEWVSEFAAWVVPAITGLTAKLPGIFDAIFNWISDTAGKIGPKLIEWLDAFTSSVHEYRHDNGARPGMRIKGSPRWPQSAKRCLVSFSLWHWGLPLKILQLIPPLTLWIATSLVPALATALLAVGVALYGYIKDTLLPGCDTDNGGLGQQNGNRSRRCVESWHENCCQCTNRHCELSHW